MPEWLEDRLGPFAVWQWLAIVAAGIALGLVVRRYNAGDDEGQARTLGDPTQDPFAGTQATGGPGILYSAPDRSAGLTTTSGKPKTNREWLAAASQRVLAIGLYQAAEIDGALRQYLQGIPLSPTALAIVNDALQLVGPPPEGAPPIERDEAIPSNSGPVPSGGFAIDAPEDGIGIYTVDDQLVRVGGDPSGGDAHARLLTEYGSAGGRAAIIDTLADVRFVERARGVERDDPHTARMILRGEFGPVHEPFRPTIERIAKG